MPDKEMRLRTMAVDVAAVASYGYGWWSAYIGAALSSKHENDMEKIYANGDKLDYKIAKILFPDLDEKYTWNP